MSKKTKTAKSRKNLRSANWFAPDNLRAFGHRSRARQMGWSDDDFGRPVIAIINTWNELNTCHTHFPERVADIKRGIIEAGGVPVELPAISLGEQLMKPSAMMYRNFLAMETEELLRAYPVDGAVLMGGCDKTTPGVLMGALSANLPAVYVPAGAMMRGHWRGQTLGSGTDVWKHWDARQAGELSECAWRGLERGIARTPGTCMTMGTAATMMLLAEALGMSLPGAASLPAVDSDHRRMARASGALAVGLTHDDIRPADIITLAALENAISALMAAGGSTNAIIHLTALARRAGIPLSLERFEEIAANTPLLANIKPSGSYVMEDLHRAGGSRALLARIPHLPHPSAPTVNGKTLGENIADAEVFDDEVIRRTDNPLQESGSLAVLRGTLAPDGCVIKTAAADKKLWQHKGAAVVFESPADLKARIDSPDLPVTANSVLILKNAGPVGAPGMPEWGQLPIPKKLLQAGVRDMVRLSDARMSGTSYGACVLHIAPESAVGGPLSLVQDGDLVELNVSARELNLLVAEDELSRRREALPELPERRLSGYGWLYTQHVTQANVGCDFDFAVNAPGSADEPAIF